MFTVIVCSDSIIEACTKKFDSFLSPVLSSENFGFCRWNINGSNLEEALPDLRTVIKGKREWQALIVTDATLFGYDSINKLNPFDHVGTVGMLPMDLDIFEEIDLDIFEECDYDSAEIEAAVEETLKKYDCESKFEVVRNYRQKKLQNYEEAKNDPLTKLCAWFTGCPVLSVPYVSTNARMLREKSGKDYYKYIIANYAEDDYIHPAIAEYECIMEERAKIAIDAFQKEPVILEYPKNILLFGERSTSCNEEIERSIVNARTEHDYSKFYEDNLYSDKLRYVLYNIDYINEERKDIDLLNFVTCLLVIASNGYPYEAFRANRVYSIDAKISIDKLSELCDEYCGKLKATHIELLRKRDRLTNVDLNIRIDDETAEKLFEGEVLVPVDVNDRFDKKDLYAEDKVGLARDCPQEEEFYWRDQYKKISKLFLKYLREPRRAVSKAAKGQFREYSIIEDERALALNEYQIEDVHYKLHDEEIAMIGTHTTNLYNTKKYNKTIEEANQRLLKEIGFRMKKRSTVLIGVTCIAAFLFGFMPFIFSELNDKTSLPVALLTALGCCALFAAIGFCYIWSDKRRIKMQFFRFNKTMKGVLNEIDSGMKGFSQYLSHACNVRREFAVLSYIEESETQNQKDIKILNKHLYDIDKCLQEVSIIFADFLTKRYGNEVVYDPYDFDFLVNRDYIYEFPVSETKNEINFLQEGNIVSVPVDYIVSVKLRREELYD